MHTERWFWQEEKGFHVGLNNGLHKIEQRKTKFFQIKRNTSIELGQNKQS